MKKLNISPLNNPGSFTALFAMLLGAILLTSACRKSNDDNMQPAAALSVVNLIPGNSAIDFYVNNLRVNNSSMLYLQSLNYFDVFPGVEKFDVTIGGTFQTLATDTATLKPGQYYSLFVTEKDNVQFLVTPDDLSDPPAGKAKIRFINLSADSPNLDIALSGSTPLFTNRAFESFTSFVTVDPATYTIDARQSGSSTNKVSKTDIKLDAGGIYTIVTYGLWNGTTNQEAFGLDVVRNK